MTNILRWIQPPIKTGLATTKNIKYCDGYVSLEYTCNGFWHDRLENTSTNWDLIYIPECTNVTTPGMPSLPMETLLIALPYGEYSNARIEVVHAEFKTVEGHFDISPAPLEERIQNQAPSLRYHPNPEVYESTEPFPSKFARPGAVRILSGLRTASIVLSPLRYIPQDRKLEFLERAHLHIIYEEGPPLAAGGGFFSSSLFKQIHGGEIVGASMNKEKPPIAGKPPLPLYLIVTSKTLAPSLQPLINHRKSQFDCKIIYIDDFPGSSPSLEENIKREIIKNFSSLPSGQPLGTILIGGAHSIVPAYTYKREYEIGTQSFLSDHFYAEFEDNYYPTVPIGRLPAASSKEMEQMVAQIINYENMTGEWQKRFWNCGYKEQKFDDNFMMPIKIINSMLQGLINVEWAIFNVSDPEALKKALDEFYIDLNSGVSVANYNGHGQVDAWQQSVTVEDLNRITPNEGLPVVICSACNNGMLDAENCFASAWMLEGKSIGVIAATSFSHVWINGEFDCTLIRAMIKNDPCLGDILNWAKTETLKNNMEDPNDKPLSVDNARMYLLLGDPALKLRALFSS